MTSAARMWFLVQAGRKCMAYEWIAWHAMQLTGQHIDTKCFNISYFASAALAFPVAAAAWLASCCFGLHPWFLLLLIKSGLSMFYLAYFPLINSIPSWFKWSEIFFPGDVKASTKQKHSSSLADMELLKSKLRSRAALFFRSVHMHNFEFL